MTFELTILGSSSATPIFNRNPTAQVVNINEKLYLIDCGEAAQIQMLRYRIKSSKIDQIFISHLHGDHYFGLIGLISSFHLNGRNKPLSIYGPKGLKEIVDIQLSYSGSTLRYPIEFIEIDSSQSGIIYQNDDMQVSSIVLNHRIPCTGFLFELKPRKRRIHKELIEAFNLTPSQIMQLKAGDDIRVGEKELKNEIYTLDPLPVKKYAFCSDTLADDSYLDTIQKVDLLYHEATFLHEFLDRANETFHTTAKQAAEVALKANAAKLLIGHFSARYVELTKHLAESRAVFENTFLAIEGEKFEI